jgi:hypothetical protein
VISFHRFLNIVYLLLAISLVPNAYQIIVGVNGAGPYWACLEGIVMLALRLIVFRQRSKP